jgi:hypothetical protein
MMGVSRPSCACGAGCTDGVCTAQELGEYHEDDLTVADALAAAREALETRVGLAQACAELCDVVEAELDDEDLSGFDPTKEGGGGPCERCGRRFEPWMYSALCQACIWDGTTASL